MYSSAPRKNLISNYAHAVTPREYYTGLPENEGQDLGGCRQGRMREFNSQHSARCYEGAHYTRVIIFQKPQQEGRRGFARMLSESLHHPQITQKVRPERTALGRSEPGAQDTTQLWMTDDKQDPISYGRCGPGPQLAPQEL